MSENQRWRLLGSCAEELSTSGYAGITVAAVTRRAAVSKGTFYQHFDNLEDCIVSTYGVAADAAVAAVGHAHGPEFREGDGLAGILPPLLDFFHTEASLGKMLTEPALDAVDGIIPLRRQLFERCVGALTQTGTGGPLGRKEDAALLLAGGTARWLSLRSNSASASPVSSSTELAELISMLACP